MHHKIIFTILIFVICISSVWGISPDCRRFALIIGADAPKTDAAYSCHRNDTAALKDVFENICGYETAVITDKTSKDGILQMLQDIACAQSLKSLVFCFSGYGFNYRRQPFFIFGDYDAAHPVATALSYDELLYYFRMINDRTKVMAFIDYTFTGANADAGEEFVTITKDRGIKVIMSGSPKPLIYKDYEKPRSVFSFFLTEGLRGEADANADGITTFGEISDYIVSSCRNYMIRNKYEAHYLPEIFADTRDGDFNINGRKPAKSQAQSRPRNDLITFNERFNEAYNSEFGSANANADYDHGLLTLVKSDFFDVRTFQPTTVYAKSDTEYVGLDMYLRLSRLPDPHSKIILSVYFYYPDGSLMCKLDKPCRPLSAPGMMNCRVIYGWNETGRWQTGKYTVKILYKDELLSVTDFRIR